MRHAVLLECSRYFGVSPRPQGWMHGRKLLRRLLTNTANVRFDDMIHLVEGFGFRLSRVRGSHHIFVRDGVPEPVNLQNVGGEAKPYQIRQFLRLVEKHNLRLED